MDLLANSHASLALVNLVFAAIALGVGFAAGAWVCGAGNNANWNQNLANRISGQADSLDQLDRERTAMATDRLRDLACGVASDVGAHNASIGKIEAELAASRDSAPDVSAEAIVRAMADISAANNQLQQKLVQAEQQIQSQAEQIKTHESEARTDSLTQLANRRAFDDELKRRFSEWNRKGTPFSLLIGDVDNFKKFNDTHGHQAGDEVLRKVGQALAQQAREMDLPCRYGGEEFAIVLPSTVGRDGSVLAERVRKAIEKMTIPFEGKSLQVTMSLGLAQAEADDSPARIIKRADEALYKSKDEGRNNCHRHEAGRCIPLTPGLGLLEAPSDLEHNVDDGASSLVLDGLPNRTKLIELLRTGVRDAQENDQPAALLGARFEGFEQLKSEFGIAVAMLTLDSIAQFLDNALRDVDHLSRLDDGEFMVLMPGSTADEAQEIGLRISTALSNCSVPLGGSTLKLCTAISATELRASDTAVTFMQRAEEALSCCGEPDTEPALA